LKAGQLSDQLPNQSQADDRDFFAQGNVSNPNGVEGDAAERGEAGVFERDALGNFRDEVATDQDGLGVSRPFATIGDSVSNFDVGNSIVLSDHHPSARISQNRVLAEFCKDFPGRADRSFVFHHVQDFANVGRVLGYRSQCTTAMNAGGLSAAADERGMRTNNYVMGRDDGVGNLVDDDLLEPLPQQLLH